MRPMALRVASDKVLPMSLRWARRRPLTSKGFIVHFTDQGAADSLTDTSS